MLKNGKIEIALNLHTIGGFIHLAMSLLFHKKVTNDREKLTETNVYTLE